MTNDAPTTVTGDQYWRMKYDVLKNTLERINLETYSVTLESITRIASDTHETEVVRLKLIASLAHTALRAIMGSGEERR